MDIHKANSIQTGPAEAILSYISSHIRQNWSMKAIEPGLTKDVDVIVEHQKLFHFFLYLS